MAYLDEVVRFIEKNTSGVHIGSGANQFADPFTGNIIQLPRTGVRIDFHD